MGTRSDRVHSGASELALSVAASQRKVMRTSPATSASTPTTPRAPAGFWDDIDDMVSTHKIWGGRKWTGVGSG